MIEQPENINQTEEISAERMKAIVQDVIDDKYLLFDAKTMADYDADFSGAEPLFINIWNKQPGHEFGYLVFHDFLRRVGMQKTFLITDFTDQGRELFKKAVADGLIEKISKPFGLHNLTQWMIIGDPTKNLEKIRDKI
jgi:hypothetical protein